MPSLDNHIRHRLLDARGQVFAEFERDGALPDRFEYWIGGPSP